MKIRKQDQPSWAVSLSGAAQARVAWLSMLSKDMNRRTFVGSAFTAALAPVTYAQSAPKPLQKSARERWLDWVERVAEPVLAALAQRKLRSTMPTEAAAGHAEERSIGGPLEAFGRLMMGLAPWLELDPSAGETARETSLRSRYRVFMQKGIAAAFDTSSHDYMRFGDSAQTVVDASFVALAMLRAPKQLIDTMSPATRLQVIDAMRAERKILTGLNNWVLFAAMDEALLFRLGADWDRMRVAYALNELQSWYRGDGVYGDGSAYPRRQLQQLCHAPVPAHADAGCRRRSSGMEGDARRLHKRASRYADIQERSIGPDGTFPVLGRSITYRAGAFQLLADTSLRGLLPKHLSPAQVRCALTSVQARTLDAPNTFDANGWLRIGLAGHQPSLGETYISTGSLYLCSAAWLPLGAATGPCLLVLAR